MMPTRPLAVVWFVLSSAASSQEPIVFRSHSQLVTIHVSALDRHGRAITTLNRDDFVVTEDGRPQPIAVFERHEFPTHEPQVHTRSAIRMAADETRKPNHARRLLMMVFDLSTLSFSELTRSRQAVRDFITQQMLPEDRVTIIATGSRLRRIQDFTADRDALLQALDKLSLHEESEQAGEQPSTDEPELAVGSEAALFATDQRLATLREAIEGVAGIPDKKALVYFCHRLRLVQLENYSTVTGVVNSAIRGNVALFPVDARGLVAYAPAGDADDARRATVSLYSGQVQHDLRTAIASESETLYEFAQRTGGRVTANTNDLLRGPVEAQQSISQYYMIGYYKATQVELGQWRRIRVASRVRGIRLTYKPGYFEPPRLLEMESDPVRVVETALAVREVPTQFPIGAAANFFRVGPGTSLILLSARFPLPPEIPVGSQPMVGLRVWSAKGRVVANLSDALTTGLWREGASAQFDAGLELRPGTYRIRLVVLIRHTENIGVFESTLRVPSFPDSASSRSSVIWSTRQEPDRTRQTKGEYKSDPLAKGGQHLLPSMTHVFHQGGTLRALCEFYTPEALDTPPDLIANITLIRGREPVVVGAATEVGGWSPLRPAGTATAIAALALGGAPPGDYVAQFSVVDRARRQLHVVRRRVKVII